MRRTYLCIFLLLFALVASFSIYAHNSISSQAHREGNGNGGRSERDAASTPIPVDTYLYYTLKGPAGFVLARAQEGSHNQPLSIPKPVTLLGDGFGQATSDTVLAIQLSPDKRYLAIDGTRADAEQVWVYDTQSTQVRLLPGNALGNFLRWLPAGNGHTFLFRPIFPAGPLAPTAREDWQASMWLVDAATGGHTNVALGVSAAELVDAAFSPDGLSLVYSTSAGLGLGSDVWLIKSNQGLRTHLLKSSGLQAVNGLFSWSPDGKKVAYERLADSTTAFLNASLWLMDMQGQQPQQPQRLADVDGGHGYAPVWAPDSRKIAFVARTNNENALANIQPQALQSAIGVVDTGSKQTWLVATAKETGVQLNISPVWASDGLHITFIAQNAVNQVFGGTPAYWSAPVTNAQVRPAATVLTQPIPSVVAFSA